MNTKKPRHKNHAHRLDQNDLFKHAIDLISDAVLLLDRKHKVVFVNTPTPALLGLTRQAIVGKTLDCLLTLEDPATRRPLVKIPPPRKQATIFLASIGDTLFNATLLDIQRTPGFNKLKSTATAVLFIRPSDHTLASAPNIHQQLIGQLTMRIAHDFNNSLTSMLGNAELVQEALQVINTEENNSPDTPAGYAMTINKDVIRKCVEMATFIRKLQDYARQQPDTRQLLDPNSIIQEMLPISQKLFGSKLTVEFLPAPTLPSVIADQTQLHQILFTLLDNCKERSGSSTGTITIQTKLVTLDEHYQLTHPGCQAGEHVQLSISDTGASIVESSLPQTFELFSSPKVDPGSGLRLATVYAILKQLGGYIYVETIEPTGNRFELYFPLRPALSRTDVPPAPIQTNRPGSRSRRAKKRAKQQGPLILVAEDQPDILKTMDRHLSKAGYQTDLTNDGQMALSRFHQLCQNGHRPSLVIADLGLPGLDGKTLCKKIRETSPRTPLLLTSGHVIPLDQANSRTIDGGFDFIQKPFDASTLLNKIDFLLR
jgi:signal transduction histidine kinase/ActR/RegA family two-component response regulator